MLRVFFILALGIGGINSLFGINVFEKLTRLDIEGTNWKIYKLENLAMKEINKKLVFSLQEYNDTNRSSVDLELKFESPNITLPNYKLIYSQFEQNGYESVNGAFSGKFYLANHYISLLPLSSSIFSPGNITGSFTIDFWLYAYKNFDNQYIVRYIGNNISDEKDKNNYGFIVYTKDNKVYYQFNNLFWDNKHESFSIEIGEDEPMKTYEWEHHAISFNIFNGRIATYKNGVEQEVKWVTENGKPLSPIFNPAVKGEMSAPILIGKNAFFSLDNLKISKKAIDQFYLNRFVKNPASLTTDIYKISDNLITLEKLYFDFGNPPYSYVKLAYRIADSYFSPDNSQIPWIYVQNGIDAFPPDARQGKYIQFKVMVYPYEKSDEEIRIQSVQLDYRLDSSPRSPILVNITPMDGEAVVSWIPCSEDDIAGYEIYYGHRIEDYVCSDAKEGKSPIFVPMEGQSKLTNLNYRLSGLVNEAPYFMAICAVDKSGHKSPYSKEMYVRPSTVWNDNKYSIGR